MQQTDDKQFLAAYEKALKAHGSQRKAAVSLGIPRSTLMDRLEAIANRPRFLTDSPAKPHIVAVPRRATRRFIFTAAQDRTAIHAEFLTNLEAYAAHLGATIHIAGFTYNKRLFESHDKGSGEALYHDRIMPYLTDRQFDIGNDLVFCGNMNTLPTAVSPLTGFESYTRHRSGIFPHAKVQLVSVPVIKGMRPKMLVTTGAVTRENYVQKRAGIKAHFHHVVAAVIVELDTDGDTFVRHLMAEQDGSFQDLTTVVADGVVTFNNRVEAIAWGDLHSEQVDPDVMLGAFGIGAHENEDDLPMVDCLEPSYQFFHDVSDFGPRNHHNIRDPHHRIKMHFKGTESVDAEFNKVALLLAQTSRPYAKSVIVESNHDLALLRWLRESDWKSDPINAEFWLEAQAATIRALRSADDRFSVLEWALRRKEVFSLINDICFLREDESFPLLSVEFGMHGHLGANGAKPNPKGFAKFGPKSVTGHTHSSSIHDGVYTVGTFSKLNLGYNRGASSWSHTACVLYPNGKRTLVTFSGRKWRAV